jgi:hypothetical protein
MVRKTCKGKRPLTEAASQLVVDAVMGWLKNTYDLLGIIFLMGSWLALIPFFWKLLSGRISFIRRTDKTNHRLNKIGPAN